MTSKGEVSDRDSCSPCSGRWFTYGGVWKFVSSYVYSGDGRKNMPSTFNDRVETTQKDDDSYGSYGSSFDREDHLEVQGLTY